MSTLAAITYGLKADGQRPTASPDLASAATALREAARALCEVGQLEAFALHDVAQAADNRESALRHQADMLDLSDLRNRAQETFRVALATYATARAHAVASGEVEP